MVKIWNCAGLNHTFDFFNITFCISREQFTGTAVLVTSQKSINPAKTQAVNLSVINYFKQGNDKIGEGWKGEDTSTCHLRKEKKKVLSSIKLCSVSVIAL